MTTRAAWQTEDKREKIQALSPAKESSDLQRPEESS
jgi:hypothetical protein